MARPLRLEFEGAFYHITSRGNSKQAIYFQDSDYFKFLEVLQHVCERHFWRIHAYCLMTNHYHLVVETPVANLSIGMQQLNGVYTQYVNKVYERCGHIFQGRFKSIVVDSDSYYTTLIRYVLQNPLRAQMVSHIAEYKWTSYHASIGKWPAPDWLVVQQVLQHFHHDSTKAKAAFAAFCQITDEKPLWDQLTNQIFLGDDSFTQLQLAKIAQPASTTDIPVVQRRSPVLPLEEYQRLNTDRNQAIAAAFHSGGYSMTDLAKHFSLHISTISKLLRVRP